MTKKIGVLPVVAILAVLYFLAGGQIPGVSQQAAVQVPATQEVKQSVPTPGTYVTVSDVTFSASPYDHFTPGVTIDLEVVLQKDGSTIWDTDNASSATKTLSPGSKYMLYMWDDSQTTNLAGTAISLSGTEYYGYSTEITIPSKTSVVFPADFETDYSGSYKTSAYSLYVKNPDGTINSSSNEADLSAGDVKTFTLVFEGPNNASYGDPYSTANMVLACDFNYVLHEKSKLSVSVDGVDAPETSVPSVYTGTVDKAFELPFNSLIDNAEKEVKLTTEIDDSYDPVDATADLNCYLMDSALWHNADTGEFLYGVDNTDTDTDIGYTQTVETIYIK